MILISFLSILIGSYGLMLTLAIMNGFEVATCAQLQNIHAEVIIRAFGNPINITTLKPVLEEEFPEICAFSPYSQGQILIQNPHTNDISTIVGIQGIEATSHVKVNNLKNKLVWKKSESTSLAQTIQEDAILIGQKLADELGITVGDKVVLFFSPEEPRGKKIHLLSKEVTVGGLFNIGIEDFDTGLIFSSLSLFHKLFPETGITHIQLKFCPQVDELELIKRLQNRLKLEVYSWKELYPALVSTLKLEKYAMLCILGLISFIAAMNIISLIFMLIYQRRIDIAILQVMGMPSNEVQSIFFRMGFAVAASASACGVGLALATASLLQKYPFISLPDTYIISHLPVAWEWYMPFTIFIVTLLITLPAILIPLSRIEKRDIAQILKSHT